MTMRFIMLVIEGHEKGQASMSTTAPRLKKTRSTVSRRSRRLRVQVTLNGEVIPQPRRGPVRRDYPPVSTSRARREDDRLARSVTDLRPSRALLVTLRMAGREERVGPTRSRTRVTAIKELLAFYPAQVGSSGTPMIKA